MTRKKRNKNVPCTEPPNYSKDEFYYQKEKACLGHTAVTGRTQYSSRHSRWLPAERRG